MSKRETLNELVSGDDWHNGHDTRTYDEFEEATGEPREVWDQRIWDSVKDRDLLFINSTGPGNNHRKGRGLSRSSTSNKCLHLPAEFLEPDEFDHEPNEKTTDDVTLCRDHKSMRWEFKEPAVWPPGWKRVCQYCLAEWADWYGIDFSEVDNG